jgi:hypothetical protein
LDTATFCHQKGLKPLQNVAVSSFWRTATHRPSFHFDGTPLLPPSGLLADTGFATQNRLTRCTNSATTQSWRCRPIRLVASSALQIPRHLVPALAVWRCPTSLACYATGGDCDEEENLSIFNVHCLKALPP